MNRPGTYLLPVLLLGLSLSGCASLGERMCSVLDCPPPEVSPSDDSIEPAPAWVEQLRRDISDTEAERGHRYDALRERIDPDHCDALTVRTATLFVLHPDPPTDDLERLEAALQRCASHQDGNDYHVLARVLLPHLQSQQSRREVETALQEELATEQARNAALEEQIEALRAIDQSIRERGR